MVNRFVHFAAAAAIAVVIASSTTAGAQPICGDADNSGGVTAGDALRALKVSVGAASCDVCLCDVNQTGTITVADALALLRFAVGQGVQLHCIQCAEGCQSSEVPTCGGSCDNGRTCAPDPEEDSHCDCFTPCELDDAPACNASCEGNDGPGSVCTNVHFSDGSKSLDRCVCLPPDSEACADSSAPACGGICGPGHACVASSNKCVCQALPVQGTCQNAAAPMCAGTCGANKICQPSGETCACVTDNQDDEGPCRGAQPNQCGAACADGRSCSKDFLSECSCHEQCQISNAPACGGACRDQGAVCTHLTASIGGSAIDYCDCVTN